MKPTITAAAVFAWFALAAPSDAGAFTGGAHDPAPGLRIAVTGGASRYDWFAGQAFYFGRPLHDYRLRGFRHYGNRHVLPARAIIRSLRVRQFCRISFPRLRRGFYHARARDAYGRRVRLVIDPYSGHIIRLRYR